MAFNLTGQYIKIQLTPNSLHDLKFNNIVMKVRECSLQNGYGNIQVYGRAISNKEVYPDKEFTLYLKPGEYKVISLLDVLDLIKENKI